MRTPYTDMALEAKTIWENSAGENSSLDGVSSEQYEKSGCVITSVKIESDKASELLCKPKGEYITVEPRKFLKHEAQSMEDSAKVIAEILYQLTDNIRHERILFAGIGNRNVTPDSFGPVLADRIIATAHLKKAFPEDFARFSSVYVISPGVLGTTGIESADIIGSIAKRIGADCIIIADALFSASTERLCNTVQLSNTGLIPGAGVGNARSEISEDTMEIPVLSIGVPTVTDIYSAASEIFELGEEKSEAGNMVVTPRDIDSRIRDIAYLTSYGVNMALHEGLTAADIDMLI